MMNYYTFDDLVKIDRNNREKLHREMRKVMLGESEKPETAYWINEDCT